MLRATWNPLYRMYQCNDGLMRTTAEVAAWSGPIVVKGGPLTGFSRGA